jgi:hypothetical protein
MKSTLIISLLCVSAIIASCKKEVISNSPKTAPVYRTIKFVLYTNKDVSNNQHDVSFKLFIENSKFDLLWDSTLAPMKVKDIPGSDGKIVVEKLVPNDDNSVLRVGFHYNIEDTGNSSYFQSFAPGQSVKIIDFNFQ